MARKGVAKGDSRSGSASMTGYGKSTTVTGDISIEVEIRGVNNRFLDVVCRFPKSYGEFENEVRSQVQAVVTRGRVEITVTRSSVAGRSRSVVFDKNLFDEFLGSYKVAYRRAGADVADHLGEIISDVMQRREVLDCAPEIVNSKSEEKSLQAAIHKALEDFCAMRQSEGDRLRKDITQRIDSIVAIGDGIAKKAAQIPSQIQARIEERIKALVLPGGLDEARLAQEVAHIVDRADVEEELVRLRSHCEEFRSALAAPGMGRKLDFLVQELGREFNTIGSKAQNAQIQAAVVSGKVELEKIREQVQNLE